MGGKCAYCGYSRCNDALALHHLDPSQKELSISNIRANPKSWSSIVKELRKCILLCHNCHSEVHAGFVSWPEITQYFNEDFVEYKEVVPQTFCAACESPKSFVAKYCSKSCYHADKTTKADWSQLNHLKETMNNVQIAKLLGVSETAVRKALKRLSC